MRQRFWSSILLISHLSRNISQVSCVLDCEHLKNYLGDVPLGGGVIEGVVHVGHYVVAGVLGCKKARSHRRETRKIR